MSRQNEKVIFSEFDPDFESPDYGYEYVERDDGSHFIRVWGEGFIQREIEFEELIAKIGKTGDNMGRKDLINQIKHVVQTLEAAQSLVNKDSLVQCMIEGAVQELEAMISEEV